MRARDILFVAGILAVISILYLLSTSGVNPPAIPNDQPHAAATAKEACQGCHAQGKASPLKKEHPPKDQCFECHKRTKQ